MTIKLLKPINDKNFNQCLNKLNTITEKEQFMIFIHYLIVQLLKKEHLVNFANIEVSNKVLFKQIFNTKSKQKIITIACEEWAIHVNESYIVGERCKKYRVLFFDDFRIQSYDYEFKYKTNSHKFNYLFSSTNKTHQNSNFDEINSEVQLEFIAKLELNKTLFNSTLKELIQNKKVGNKASIHYFNHLQYVEYECYNFNNLKSFSLYDNFSNRYYNFFTNKPSQIRKCFKIEGKDLKSLDIKSSQIYFLSQLDKLDLSNYQIDKAKISIEAEFKKLVLEDDIYQFFANELKIERNKAKKWLLSYLYGHKRMVRLKKVIQDNFPHLSQTLSYLMSIKINNPKYCFEIVDKKGDIKVKNNYFNFILQSIEREVFLKSLEGLNDYYTIHDSVYFQNGREEEFKSKILNFFSNLCLDQPNLCLE